MEIIWRWRKREGMMKRRKRSGRSADGLYFLSRAAELVHQTFYSDSDLYFVSKYWVSLLESESQSVVP